MIGALFGGAMWASRPTKFYRRLAVERGALTPPLDRHMMLSGAGISGSGAEAETILLTKRNREIYVNVRETLTI